MCQLDPDSVSIAKKSALDRAANEFGLMSADEIKKFIGDDAFDSTSQCRPTQSDLLPGTTIAAYKFTSGSKKGYLAFHRPYGKTTGIHIKSFHKDDTDPSLGTMEDLFKDLLGGKK